MNTRLKKLAGAATLALALSGLAACGSDDGSPSSDNTAAANLELISSGTLTVCSEVPYKPFEYEENGEFTGFDIDLIRDISDSLGLKLEILPSSFDALESGLALNSGTCDVVASAMTITDERKQNVDFADGNYDSKQSLLVPVGSDITSIDDLAGKKVAVQSTTTGETFTNENAPEGTDIVGFPGDQDMFNALKAGQVEAILQDLPVNLVHTQEGDYTIVQEFDTNEQYGWAVKKDGAPNLLKALNDGLAKLKSDGTYQEVYDKYFSVK